MDLPTGYFIVTLGLSSIGCLIAGILISNLFGISLVKQSGDSEGGDERTRRIEKPKDKRKIVELIPFLLEEELTNLSNIREDATEAIKGRLEEEHGDKLEYELYRGPRSHILRQELENPYLLNDAADCLGKIYQMFDKGHITAELELVGSNKSAKKYLDEAVESLKYGMEKWGEDPEIRARIGESLSHLYKIRDKYLNYLLE